MHTLINEYRIAKNDLVVAKKLEGELRLALLAKIFPDGTGACTTEAEGFKIKGNFGLSFSLDKNVELDGMSESEVNCVSFKPGLVLAKYKALEDDERMVLDQFVTCKPAMPTLKIEEL